MVSYLGTLRCGYLLDTAPCKLHGVILSAAKKTLKSLEGAAERRPTRQTLNKPPPESFRLFRQLKTFRVLLFSWSLDGVRANRFLGYKHGAHTATMVLRSACDVNVTKSMLRQVLVQLACVAWACYCKQTPSAVGLHTMLGLA